VVLRARRDHQVPRAAVGQNVPTESGLPDRGQARTSKVGRIRELRKFPVQDDTGPDLIGCWAYEAERVAVDWMWLQDDLPRNALMGYGAMFPR